jgi:hypothetical protein
MDIDRYQNDPVIREMLADKVTCDKMVSWVLALAKTHPDEQEPVEWASWLVYHTWRRFITRQLRPPVED